MDRGAWRATVCGIAKSRTRLSNQHYMEIKLLEGSFGFFFFSSFLNVYVYISWSSWLCMFNKPVKTAVFRSGRTGHGKWGDFYVFSRPAVLTATGKEWLWIAGLGMWGCVFRIWTPALGAWGLRRLWAANCACWRGRDAGPRSGRKASEWFGWWMHLSWETACF